MVKMTRTFTRSHETMTRYIESTTERMVKGIQIKPFENWEQHAIKAFKYWFILENEFPYDAIATVNYMIAPKREVAFDWRLLTAEEKKELEVLKETYLNENYDVVWENLPKGMTIPAHFHLHLLVLKREEI